MSLLRFRCISKLKFFRFQEPSRTYYSSYFYYPVDPNRSLIEAAEIGYKAGVLEALERGAIVYEDAKEAAEQNDHRDIVDLLEVRKSGFGLFRPSPSNKH